MKSLKVVQDEMKPWQAHNFPNRPAWIPLCGMMEELGELADQTMNRDIDIVEVLDAIGDITIYLCDFANSQNYNLLEIWGSVGPDEDFMDDNLIGLTIDLGKLYHSFIKTFQNIRMHEDHPTAAKRAIGRILAYLVDECEFYDTDLDRVLSHTWNRVKQRDWQKNRNTAHQQV